jgi:hypothetical protein
MEHDVLHVAGTYLSPIQAMDGWKKGLKKISPQFKFLAELNAMVVDNESSIQK